MKKISNETHLLLERRYKEAALLSLSLIAVVTVMLAGVYLIELPVISIDDSDVNTLWVGVIFLAVGALLVRRVRNRWDVIKDIFLLKGFEGVFAKLKRDSLLVSLFGLGIGILGAVIFLTTESVGDLLRSFFVAALALAVGFPRKKIWRRIASELEGR